MNERSIELWDETIKTWRSTPVPEEIADLLEPCGEVYQKLCTWIGGIPDCEVPSSGDYAEMRNIIFKFILDAFHRGRKASVVERAAIKKRDMCPQCGFPTVAGKCLRCALR